MNFLLRQPPKNLPDRRPGRLSDGFQFHRTVFHATPAAGAKLHIDEARLFADLYLKTAFFPGDAFNFGESEQLNIDMPADLDQFGGDDSHRAIVGRESLIKLRHHSADGT